MYLVHSSRGSQKHVVAVLLRGCWLHYKMAEKGKCDEPVCDRGQVHGGAWLYSKPLSGTKSLRESSIKLSRQSSWKQITFYCALLFKGFHDPQHPTLGASLTKIPAHEPLGDTLKL